MNNTRLTLLALSISVIAGCNSGSSSHSGSGGQVDSKGVYRSVCQENLGGSDKGLTFTVEGSVAKLTGIVCSGSPAAFERMMKENPQVKTLNFVTVGGSINDDANLELAYKVRNKRLDSLINSNGLIASGGTDLFIAGVQRTIETGAKIGVHSWATEDDDGKEIQGADLPKDHPDHQGYIRYYRAMGLAQPSEFYFFTLEKAPSDGMHYMTEAELTTYQVGSVTTNPRFWPQQSDRSPNVSTNRTSVRADRRAKPLAKLRHLLQNHASVSAAC
ncbi:alpha/beta hydrolase [Vibrio vulnificus]